MISSPCRDCPRLGMPKIKCSLVCEKINKIQKFQVCDNKNPYYSELDACKEGAFALNPYKFSPL